MPVKHPLRRGVSRRTFVSAATTVGVALWRPRLAAGLRSAENGQAKPNAGEEEEGVTPTEDLMREHGVLKRVLLVYEEVIRRIDTRQDVPPDAVRDSAMIIRTFIEDYHEKLEEDYLFPRFEKARQLIDLTGVLRAQHEAGRRVTDQVAQLATAQSLKAPESATKLRDLLYRFTRMYAPHEAREDTVLFPAFRKLVSSHEYGALGEDFEKREHQLFGAEGFERFVDRIAGIEKRLGLYDLAQFTPQV